MYRICTQSGTGREEKKGEGSKGKIIIIKFIISV
jgi:hypothetical protein